MGRLPPAAQRVLTTLANLIVTLIVIVVGQLLPPLRALDAYLQAHPALDSALRTVTIGMALLGALVLALGQFVPGPPATPGTGDSPRGFWHYGRRIARPVHGTASFREVKEAWRAQAWRYDRGWRVLFVMMAGALLTLCGVFGFPVVAGPPSIKLLTGGLLLYALGRTAWGFIRA